MSQQKPEPLTIHYKILDYIEEMKKKAHVSIQDLEKYYTFLQVLDRDIQRLKDSRDKWRAKYEAEKGRS